MTISRAMVGAFRAGIVGLLLAVSLSACSGGGESESGDDTAPSAVPSTRDVTVALVDTIPLDLLANYDDESCYVGADPAEVTLYDADGTILAVNSISGVGGSMTENGCRWEISFADVPDADIYEARVKSGVFERSAIVAAAAEPVLVEIAF